MAKDKKQEKKNAYFQSGHRQSNTHGELDKDVTLEGDGVLKTKSSKDKDKKELRKTVDDILDDSQKG